MSSKEVTELRKAGKLEEAREMVEKDLISSPDDIWVKRAASWVYYAFAKQALEQKNLTKLLNHIENIKKLQLPETDKMVFDSIAWTIGKYLFANENTTPETLDRFFELIKELHFSKPKDSYTFLLKAFNKFASKWDKFTEFVDWWGLDNFMPQDYQIFTTDDGKKLPATVESIYISISKKLLAAPRDREAIKRFIPRIAKVSHEHKHMQYPPYYYAKLLLALGDKEHFMEAFMPFARKKRNDFWVWDLLSEVYDKDSPEHFACLCKSLSCGAPAKFTINVKEKLAALFEKKGMFAEAKREYSDILEAREAAGWRIFDKHENWKKLPWWNKTKAAKDNFGIYNSNKGTAENLLYADKPETLIVVDTVNREKTVLSFVTEKRQHGFIHYGRLGITPEPGVIYAVRFMEQNKENKSNFFRVYSIREPLAEPPKELRNTVKGTLTIRPGNSFGFVNDVYVPANLIKTNSLKAGTEIETVTILSYNRNKKNWGRKAVKVV
jgi:tetratricopeptide (TPR) repeat protein